MNYYNVGKIVNTHGIKGEVKIESQTDFDRFTPGNVLYIEKNRELIEVVVQTHRVHKGFDLVSFIGYDDINSVLPFKGLMIKIDEEHQEELPDGEYYFHDLIGLDVYNQFNTFIGKVIDIMDLPQGEILVVGREHKKNGLIPFVDEFIIDVLDDRIIIQEIEGLL